MKRLRIWPVGPVFALALGVLVVPTVASAAPPDPLPGDEIPRELVVTSNLDAPDANPGDGECLTARSDLFEIDKPFPIPEEDLYPGRDIGPALTDGLDPQKLEPKRDIPGLEPSPFPDGAPPLGPSVRPLEGLPVPACTLRAAIEESNALPLVQEILIPGDIGTYHLRGKALCLCKSGISSLSAQDPSNRPVIDAGGLSRIFYVYPGTANINSLVIRNGNAFSYEGGAILHEGDNLYIEDSVIEHSRAHTGGGIFSAGGLVLRDSAVRNNIATNLTGEVSNALAHRGGGIALGSFIPRLTLERSSVYDNEAHRGGGISIQGRQPEATIINSTIAGNRAQGTGGGIGMSAELSAKLDIRYSTITDNEAGISDAPEFYLRAGGGIHTYSGEVMLSASIVAGNRDGLDSSVSIASPDCFISTSASVISDHSIVGVAGPYCPVGSGHFGNASTPFDAQLGPRQSADHQAWHAPDAGSVAVHGGGGSVGCPEIDQIHNSRLAKGCDIGAIQVS